MFRHVAAVLRHVRGTSNDPLLSQLSRAVGREGTDGLQRLSAHPDLAEAQRDLLRRLGHEAEKDVGKKQEAVEEALRALGHAHPLVRLGGVHLLARVAGPWRPLRPLAGDEDLLVRLGVLRAVGRLAEQGDEEAESFLAEAARESDRNVRSAALDALQRLRGFNGSAPLLE